MARALKTVLALAVIATGFLTGGVILPVQKAEAGSCIWRHGHQYCPASYWKGDCFYYDYDLYCRVYKKKKYRSGGGYSSGGGY